MSQLRDKYLDFKDWNLEEVTNRSFIYSSKTPKEIDISKNPPKVEKQVSSYKTQDLQILAGLILLACYGNFPLLLLSLGVLGYFVYTREENEIVTTSAEPMIISSIYK
mmetsp:Transcript_12822/g.12823  ORF Transcript_12822/g.12823 Transcript_12822/m.12823 type:complete len:108 (+) Transcript_12822:1070-1393(+)